MQDFETKIKDIMAKIVLRSQQDSGFYRFCEGERNKPFFDSDLKIVEKIANIDISEISYNDNLIQNSNGTLFFNSEETKNLVLGFYSMIDSLCPQKDSLLNRVILNEQYFTTNPQDKTERSYCKNTIDKLGNPIREIFVNMEGRIGDVQTIIHEFCHSCCAPFMNFSKQIDDRMPEVPTVIADNLASLYMQETCPDKLINLIENDRFRQFLNVKKARECLMDALIVKVVTGEETIDNIVQQYGHLYEDFPNIINSRFEKIEKFEFYPMFEKKYLIPQAIALELKERYEQNPALVAEEFKDLINNNHCISQEMALTYLGLPQEDELIENYVIKFPERMAKMDKAKQEAITNAANSDDVKTN